MAKIPINRRETPLSLELATSYERVNQGKVRDTWFLPKSGEQLMLAVVTDRCSIYDIVLNCAVPMKGRVLNAMSIFWTKGPLKDLPTDLVAYGADIDKYLPPRLRGNPELQSRATVIRQHTPIPRELIARGYLTGGGLKTYLRTGQIWAIGCPRACTTGRG